MITKEIPKLMELLQQHEEVKKVKLDAAELRTKHLAIVNEATQAYSDACNLLDEIEEQIKELKNAE